MTARKLKEAIAGKRLIQCHYDGEGPRIAEPHVLGRRGPEERAQVQVYQLSNAGDSSARPGWRYFVLSDIEHLAVLDKTFPGRRRDGRYTHAKWISIEAIVSP